MKDGMNWRIRTYAQDQDVHVWSLGSDISDLAAVAQANTIKHYGDVMAEGYVIETEDGLDGVRRDLLRRGLEANLELPSSGAAFWTPNGSHFRTKSVPP